MTSRMNAVHRQPLSKLSDLIALIEGSTMAQIVSVAAELRIADLLAAGPRSIATLAEETVCHPPSLHRLLRALASLDLCIEREDGSFGLTATGDLLRSDSPNSMRCWAMWCGTYMWPVWGNLRHSIKTGESGQRPVFGMEAFEQLEHDAAAAVSFNEAMTDLTRLIAGEMVRAYDFAGTRRIVDVGGGHAALLAAILAAYPDLHGVLFDLPHALDGARARMAELGLLARCELTSGDFFNAVPAGGDVYILKSIIHDWSDARSADILRTCRRAMAPSAKLLLVELIMPEHMQACPRHRTIARTDLTMLLGPGGRERTEAEFRELLDTSGFELVRIVPTEFEFSILDAVPR